MGLACHGTPSRSRVPGSLPRALSLGPAPWRPPSGTRPLYERRGLLVRVNGIGTLEEVTDRLMTALASRGVGA